MRRSKVAVPLLMLFVTLLLSWASQPAVAVRPLEEGSRFHEQAQTGVASVIVLPSIWRSWHKLLPLEMKQHASCSTWDPNNACPTTPARP
ncbi:hypothetical protein PR202_gb17342 [Eleusine coracana subsp. coracana]|uniref:Uncharacterized protein n=1 Tax=Eleusine coracana subsp. coracana TaxID=191504 RepID=A0AAV5F4H4_ELECO|nr:hypothetical protein PR202_gb17342 [Eleusine coracana subsp. coracana]